jgi:hypothetical protein
MWRRIRTMKHVHAALALFLVSSLAQAGMPIKIDYDESVDFSQLETFGWKQTPPRPDTHPLQEGSSLDLQIRRLIERSLVAKGLTPPATGEDPDVLLKYEGGLSDQLQVLGREFGPRYEVGLTPDDLQVNRSFHQGGLLVDVMGPDGERILWSGVVLIKGPTPAAVQKKLDKAISKLLKRFPPRK